MNAIAKPVVQTMSSRQLAEVLVKRHDNVKRTIEMLAEKGVISHPQIEDGIKSANGVVFAELEIDVLKTERIYLDTPKQSNLGSNKEIRA
ncbi:MAG: hypothetical protein GAK29_00912 [Acinetobacter bereziniae]|uniref:DNA-binding protein n=1 Tax=Acinetobacter bereziniae TaxID=106648 RepID=A0A833PEB7_ACIBZ|nr:MAG: hypothetical protein GAK29_00912 [Acinetobacter bereziniae]